MANYLYIHIPFCMSKCVYCDFNSILYDASAAGKYTDVLAREMELKRGSAGDLKTVYIGGGTPSILPAGEIFSILKSARDIFSIRSSAEITIEANPGTVSEEKLQHLYSAGINRISLGAQSMVEDELKFLGRSHAPEQVSDAVNYAVKAGFDNISVDLIYGIPGQTMQTWEYTLMKTLGLSPSHISAYELTPEKHTPLFEGLQNRSIEMPDEDTVAGMYYRCLDILRDNGYIHYEISNFARPGFQCAHNLNYWNRGEYLGIGAGAHSFIAGTRYSNPRDVNRYMESIENGNLLTEEALEITPEDEIKETIFLGLRKTEGIDTRILPESRNMLGSPLVKELICLGIMETDGTFLRLTRKGLLLSSEVIAKMI